IANPVPALFTPGWIYITVGRVSTRRVLTRQKAAARPKRVSGYAALTRPTFDYAAKWRLARLLYQRAWDRQRIMDLFAVIDWLLRLPSELERRLWTSIEELERVQNMPYATSVQRLGREEGREEGWEEGREEGQREGEA